MWLYLGYILVLGPLFKLKLKALRLDHLIFEGGVEDLREKNPAKPLQ